MKRVWKVWHKSQKRWCFGNRHFKNRAAADAAIRRVTGRKRDVMTNYFRLNATPKLTHV